MYRGALAVAGPNSTSASVHRGRRRRILSPLLPSCCCLLLLALLVLLKHGAHAFCIHAGRARSIRMAAATAAAGSEERVVVYVVFLSSLSPLPAPCQASSRPVIDHSNPTNTRHSIGGGIIGASILYQLSLKGYNPILLERAEVAAAASGKSGGFLGAWACVCSR